MKDEYEFKSDEEEINIFLSVFSPFMKDSAKSLLEELGIRVVEKGENLQIYFDLTYKDRKAKFFLANYFLEVATIDRDENPLRFDKKLRMDFDYVMHTIAFVFVSKLEILLPILLGDISSEEILKRAEKNSNIERIRVTTIERNKDEFNKDRN